MFQPKMQEIKIKSYAKINLALDIVGLRDDGYHLLETVMQKIGLADDITLKWKEDISDKAEIVLSASKPYLPRDERNLAYKAAQLMAEQAGVHGRLNIQIRKKIPVTAGLGGGSSNAAAVITALNSLWNMGLNTWQLCAIGEKLGADVPFLVLVHNTGYECAFCEGTGEKMTALKRGMKKHIVLAKPALAVPTREVFGEIDSCRRKTYPDIDSLIRGLRDRDDEKIFAGMANRLEDYTLNHYAEVRKLKEYMQKTEGAQKVLMSGSGPTVFAVYETYRDSKRACLALREQGYEAYWTQTMRKTENGNRREEKC